MMLPSPLHQAVDLLLLWLTIELLNWQVQGFCKEQIARAQQVVKSNGPSDSLT
jgi:hypothetical protein